MPRAPISDLESWISELKHSGKLILVEGVKDKKALAHFGIRNIEALSGRPLYKVADDIAAKAKDVVILTDLDREGKRLYSILRTMLSRLGVRVDAFFREFLFKSTQLKQIEGLVSYSGKDAEKRQFTPHNPSQRHL